MTKLETEYEKEEAALNKAASLRLKFISVWLSLYREFADGTLIICN